MRDEESDGTSYKPSWEGEIKEEEVPTPLFALPPGDPRRGHPPLDWPDPIDRTFGRGGARSGRLIG